MTGFLLSLLGWVTAAVLVVGVPLFLTYSYAFRALTAAVDGGVA